MSHDTPPPRATTCDLLRRQDAVTRAASEAADRRDLPEVKRLTAELVEIRRALYPHLKETR